MKYKYIKSLLLNFSDFLGIDKKYLKKKFYGFLTAFDESELIARFIIKNNIVGDVVDVGLFNGSSSYDLLCEGRVVYGFEPDRDEYKKKAIKKMLENEKFVFDDRAVSDESGKKLSFYVSEESKGISSLHPFTNKHNKLYDVETVSLTDYTMEKNIKDISFLKIDTEGHDFYVLKGFPFNEINPKLILCEFEDKKTNVLGYTYKDMIEFMMDYGYKVFLFEWYPVKKYGGKHSFRRLAECPCDLIDANATGNLMAIRADYVKLFYDFLKKEEVAKYWDNNKV